MSGADQTSTAIGRVSTEPTVEQPDMYRPLATIEILLDGRFALHVRINGVPLAPMLPLQTGEAAETYYRDLLAELKDKQRALSASSNDSNKLSSFTRTARELGHMLGSVLFGSYRFAAYSGIAPHARSDLDRVLYRLYQVAVEHDRFILISFAAERPEWNELPWELTAWQANGDDVILGVDSRLAFVRQVYHPGYVAPSGLRGEARGKVSLVHVSSSRTEFDDNAEASDIFDHRRAEHHLKYLADRYEGQVDRVRIIYSSEWPNLPEQPIDIMQFVGHGSHEGQVKWMVAGDGRESGLNLGAAELLQMLRPGPGGARQRARTPDDRWLPELFVFVACDSFGLMVEVLEQAAAKRTVATVGISGKWRIRRKGNEHFMRIFYSELFTHGRLDVAVQRTRQFFYQHELKESLNPDSRVPENWFRPVLFLRDLASAGYYRDRGASAHAARGDGTPRSGHGKSLDTLRGWRGQLLVIRNFLDTTPFPVDTDDLRERSQELRDELSSLPFAGIKPIEKPRDVLLDLLTAASGGQDTWRQVREEWEGLQWEIDVLLRESRA